jgi:hypothetical protein
VRSVARELAIDMASPALDEIPRVRRQPRLHWNEPNTRGGNVMNPLDSLWGTVIAGLVITLVLYVVVRLAIGG